MTDFRGCAFINAHAELGTSNPAATEVVALHTRSLTEYLARLAREEGAAQPETLARELLLIIAGATVAASIQGDGQAAHDARELATKVLAADDLAT